MKLPLTPQKTDAARAIAEVLHEQFAARKPERRGVSTWELSTRKEYFFAQEFASPPGRA